MVRKAAAVDDEKLRLYLNTHLLGSLSGLRYFKAAASTWSHTPLQQKFQVLQKQVEADQLDLKRIMGSMGLKRHLHVRIAAPVAAIFGSLNLPNLIRLRRGPNAQVQFDLLTGFVNMKLGMWHALLFLEKYDPRLDKKTLTDLVSRANYQIQELHEMSNDSLDDRFLVRE